MQSEGLPWKKHPTLPTNQYQKTIPKRSTHPLIPTNISSSRIPMTVFNRNKIKDDDMIRASSEVEERAKNIVLSQMKIVGNTGKVRVARNQVSEQESFPPISFSSANGDEKKIIDDEAKENQVGSYEKNSEMPATQSIESSSNNTSPNNHPIFSFSKALQRSSYEFKPPSAAKYFLWDNSRIGATIFTKPDDVLYHQVKITPASLKSVRMEILKAGLLTRAQSTLSPPSILGVFFGTTIFCKEKNGWELELNRFEAGEKRSGIKNGDVVVYCVWSSVPVQDGFSYVELLEKVKEQREANPLENLETVFPIFAHFQALDGGEVSIPSFRTVIPNYSLELYPIHEIRLVNTTLSHKLLTELSVSQVEYGLMSIDQARQLYLLPWTSASIDTIPLIGVWIKSDYHTFKDDLLRKTCMRYIDNQRISKLDTGKSHLLVYYFNTEKPSRPECFECTFSLDKERPFLLYGTVKNPFDLLSDEEPGFEFALNQIFNIPLKIPDAPLNIDDDGKVDFHTEKGHFEESLIIPVKEKVQVLLEPEMKAESEMEREASSAEKENEEGEKKIEPSEPSMAIQPEMKPMLSPITSDILSQQMMYINMLQQQIATLQSQMLSISSGQFNGTPAPGFGNPFWMQQMQYQHNYMPMQQLQPNIPSNPIGIYDGQQPKPESKMEEKPNFPQPSLKESISIQVESSDVEVQKSIHETKKENEKITQDEEIQVTFILPQSQSIGTNTSFYFSQTEMKSSEQTDRSLTTTYLRNDIEKLSLKNSDLQDLSHAPTDNGKNYEVYAPHFVTSPSKDLEKPDTSACDIIAGLVEDAEESFYHTEKDDDASSMPCTTIFTKSKPIVKTPFKRPAIVAEIQRKPSFLDTSVLTGDSRESSLLRGADTRDSSLRLDPSETEDLSLSFATMKYLEKYGLSPK